MSVAVVTTRRTADWVRREAEYLRAEHPKAGERFLAAMSDALTRLSAHPRAGVAGLLPDTRILVTGDYLIFYRLRFGQDRETIAAVEIFAIRHGRQRDARNPS